MEECQNITTKLPSISVLKNAIRNALCEPLPKKMYVS